MFGLPYAQLELAKNNYVMTETIASSVISLPAGTVVSDARDATVRYLLKPLELSEYLPVKANAGSVSLDAATAIDLSTVPNYVEHGMGATPEVDKPKYSGGERVE